MLPSRGDTEGRRLYTITSCSSQLSRQHLDFGKAKHIPARTNICLLRKSCFLVRSVMLVSTQLTSLLLHQLQATTSRVLRTAQDWTELHLHHTGKQQTNENSTEIAAVGMPELICCKHLSGVTTQTMLPPLELPLPPSPPEELLQSSHCELWQSAGRTKLWQSAYRKVDTVLIQSGPEHNEIHICNAQT